MDIEYKIKSTQPASSNKRVIAWGCYATCWKNWGTISRGTLLERNIVA